MSDTADYTAGIDSRFATRIRRQMRREPRELVFTQPEAI
jgi:hypothetical protein